MAFFQWLCHVSFREWTNNITVIKSTGAMSSRLRMKRSLSLFPSTRLHPGAPCGTGSTRCGCGEDVVAGWLWKIHDMLFQGPVFFFQPHSFFSSLEGFFSNPKGLVLLPFQPQFSLFFSILRSSEKLRLKKTPPLFQDGWRFHKFVDVHMTSYMCYLG